MIDYPIKTWLTCDGYGYVYRHCEYEDGYNPESEWIGVIEHTKDGRDRWFQTYGDNRTFSPEELKQLLDFLNGVV